MRRLASVASVSLVVALAASCSGSARPSGLGTDPGDAVLALAASDLLFALQELAETYESSTGRRIIPSFGSSGNLTAQIESGAPADLFFAADESFVDRLERQGLLLEGSRRIYATGRLALIAAAGSPPEVTQVSDLARATVRRVAIANPEHAPFGRAARQALERSGMWPSIEPKLVLGENVTQAFQFVQTGNADAGLVALSVVLGGPGSAYTLVDQALYDPLHQAAAVLRSSRRAAEAAAFLDYVTGPAGRPTMRKFGLDPGEG